MQPLGTTAKKVVALFSRSGEVPGDSIEEKLQCAYLERSVVDSFGLITIIAELEEDFGIRFEMDEMLHPDFQKIGGIVAAVERQLQKKS